MDLPKTATERLLPLHDGASGPSREQKSTDVPSVGNFFDKELTGGKGPHGRNEYSNMNVMIALAPNEPPRLH